MLHTSIRHTLRTRFFRIISTISLTITGLPAWRADPTLPAGLLEGSKDSLRDGARRAHSNRPESDGLSCSAAPSGAFNGAEAPQAPARFRGSPRSPVQTPLHPAGVPGARQLLEDHPRADSAPDVVHDAGSNGAD